ncbi:MAG: trypsin-like peptidase domain-containing protein, partial [Thermaerobacterales bacterium]
SVSPSVVTVIVQTNDGSTVQGSGVIYDASGRILTNMHVVERPGEILVLLVDGRVFPASREAMDRLSDLAVLHIEAVNLTAIGFGDSSTLQAGELVVAVGSPITHRLATTVTMGIVSGIGRALTDTYYAYVQTDAALNPGNSGGPLVNMKGEVVGINTLKVEAPGVEGLSFALPANIAMKVAGDLDQLGRVRRPYLGADVQESWEAQIGLPTAAGLRVAGVVAGGPAAQAGIRAGDDMISLGGYPTGSLSQLLEAIERHAPGDSVLVEIQRAGQSLQIELTLGERPAD